MIFYRFSHFLYTGLVVFTENVCGTEWPFMCTKKLLTHSSIRTLVLSDSAGPASPVMDVMCSVDPGHLVDADFALAIRRATRDRCVDEPVVQRARSGETASTLAGTELVSAGLSSAGCSSVSQRR